jgi:hypothetical protein
VSKGKSFRYYSRTDWAINPRGQLAGDDLPAFGPPVVQVALAAAGDERGEDAETDAHAECAVGPQ